MCRAVETLMEQEREEGKAAERKDMILKLRLFGMNEEDIQRILSINTENAGTVSARADTV